VYVPFPPSAVIQNSTIQRDSETHRLSTNTYSIESGGTGVGGWVGPGVGVGRGVFVGIGVWVGCDVMVGVGVCVGCGVEVGCGVSVRVGVGGGVSVAVAVGLGVSVAVGVLVAVDTTVIKRRASRVSVEVGGTIDGVALAVGTGRDRPGEVRANMPTMPATQRTATPRAIHRRVCHNWVLFIVYLCPLPLLNQGTSHSVSLYHRAAKRAKVDPAVLILSTWPFCATIPSQL
jgi:hypothetical protein